MVETAYNAGLSTATDEQVLIYCDSKDWVLVTLDSDFTQMVRTRRFGRVVYLSMLETDSVEGAKRIVEWLSRNQIPEGRVLRAWKDGRVDLVTLPRRKRRG